MREREPAHLNEEKRLPKRLEQEKELNLCPIFISPPPRPCNFEVFSKIFIQLQWRGGSEAAGEAARLMAPPPPVMPFGLGPVSCRRHNMQ